MVKESSMSFHSANVSWTKFPNALGRDVSDLKISPGEKYANCDQNSWRMFAACVHLPHH